MRKVDLSKVPKKNNNGKELYLWSESIGLNIPFEYDNHIGSFKIVERINTEHIKVLYNNKEFDLLTRAVKCNQIEKLFGKELKWEYDIGDNIRDVVCSHRRDLTIINKKWDDTLNKNRNNKWYQYKCNICGYDNSMDDSWINEQCLKRGQGCSCCAGTKIIKGINDISTTEPWMVKYFVNIDDAYTHTSTSNQAFLMKCPICGKIKYQTPWRLLKQGFACSVCSDGISYPEKMLTKILDQLKVRYKRQLNKKDFLWCENYKYDFYLYDYDMIIETHGMQHYILRKNSKFGTLEEIQKNDKEKENLAKLNNISYYIILDCRYSTIDYIMSSINNSILSTILDLSKINFIELNKYLNKSLMVEVCLAYKNQYPDVSTLTLESDFCVDRATITRYLKDGNKIGLCNYNGVKIGAKERGNKSSQPIKVISIKGIYYFRSIKLLGQKYSEVFGKNMTSKCVFAVLKGKRDSYDNMKFEKISKEEFNEAFDNNKNVYGEKFILSIL